MDVCFPQETVSATTAESGVELEDHQMRKQVWFILSLLYRKAVSHGHLCFGRNSKAGWGMGKFLSWKKGSFSLMNKVALEFNIYF